MAAWRTWTIVGLCTAAATGGVVAMSETGCGGSSSPTIGDDGGGMDATSSGSGGSSGVSSGSSGASSGSSSGKSGSSGASGGSSGASSGSSGASSGSSGASSGSSGASSGSSSGGSSSGAACTIPDGGGVNDPGVVDCTGSPCMVPANACCIQFQMPDAGTCQQANAPCLGGIKIGCKQTADCPKGNVCCLDVGMNSGIVAECRQTCMMGTQQLCRCDEDCPANNPCTPKMCFGNPVESCGTTCM